MIHLADKFDLEHLLIDLEHLLMTKDNVTVSPSDKDQVKLTKFLII